MFGLSIINCLGIAPSHGDKTVITFKRAALYRSEEYAQRDIFRFFGCRRRAWSGAERKIVALCWCRDSRFACCVQPRSTYLDYFVLCQMLRPPAPSPIYEYAGSRRRGVWCRAHVAQRFLISTRCLTCASRTSYLAKAAPTCTWWHLCKLFPLKGDISF